MNVYSSILQAIGNTPMVRLNRVANGVDALILVKCEYLNPSGSLKDRIALRMIEEAEKVGQLKEGATVTESSDGNTAIALSFVCAVRGYKSAMFMPQGYATKDRVDIIKAYGAEVTEVGVDEVVLKELHGKKVSGGILEIIPRKKALELEENNKNVWWARQSTNPNNTFAHKDGTAKEIIEQTDGKIDAFVAAIGSGGTLLGIAETLKSSIPAVQIYGVEPEHSSLFKMEAEARRFMQKYSIPGDKGSILRDMQEKGIVDEVFLVRDEDAIEMAHRLCEEEGLFCGISSGANVHVALQIAKKYGSGGTVVTVLPDSRSRYFLRDSFVT